MSILSQAAVVLLIIVTGIILRYAYVGLANAAEEGEHFVDEWALRQQKREENLHKNPFYKENGNLSVEYDYETDSEEHKERKKIEFSYEKDGFTEGIIENTEDIIENMTENQTEAEPFRLHFPEAKKYRLIQLNEEKRPLEQYEIDHFPYKIGRDLQNDVILDDIYVAKKHCQIIEERGQVILQDLNTANKIFANGEVVEEFILSDGQHFYVGGCEFLVEEVLNDVC